MLKSTTFEQFCNDQLNEDTTSDAFGVNANTPEGGDVYSPQDARMSKMLGKLQRRPGMAISKKRKKENNFKCLCENYHGQRSYNRKWFGSKSRLYEIRNKKHHSNHQIR